MSSLVISSRSARDMQVTFHVAVEATTDWIMRSSLFAASVRRNGGRWRNGRICIRIAVPDVSEPCLLLVGDFGEIWVTPRCVDFPKLNKISGVEQVHSGGPAIFFDADTVVLGGLDGLDAYLDSDVASRYTNQSGIPDLLGPNYWSIVERFSGRDFRRLDYTNSGMVIVSESFFDRLIPVWRYWAQVASEAFSGRTGAEQVGFVLAMDRLGARRAHVPPIYNATPAFFTTDRELMDRPWHTVVFQYSSSDPRNIRRREDVFASTGSLIDFLGRTQGDYWDHFRAPMLSVVESVDFESAFSEQSRALALVDSLGKCVRGGP